MSKPDIDLFDNVVWADDVSELLSDAGVDWHEPPTLHVGSVRNFFRYIQNGLAAENVWLTQEDLVIACLAEPTLDAVHAIAQMRKTSILWGYFVEAVAILERDRNQRIASDAEVGET